MDLICDGMCDSDIEEYGDDRGITDTTESDVQDDDGTVTPRAGETAFRRTVAQSTTVHEHSDPVRRRDNLSMEQIQSIQEAITRGLQFEVQRM
jgi:hypothetical protein